MLIVMSYKATAAEIEAVVKAVQDMGFRAEPIPGGERTAVGVLAMRGTSPTPSSRTSRASRK